MFTGIVTEIGTVTEVQRPEGGADARLTVRAPGVVASAAHGDSIAVNGVCLTVAATSTDAFTADVMPETLRLTSLGALDVGDPVNIEPALTASSRLGGHLVQGHVDGLGRVAGRAPGPRWDVVRIEVPAALARYVAPKGSVAIDGVSLTVVDVHDDMSRPSFTVSLIPTTLETTTLGRRTVGECVNIEVDVLAKYVERLLSTTHAQRTDPEPIT
jgi:riboflavin synthase